MKSESIQKCALDLAQSIADRNVFDVKEIEQLIYIRFQDCLSQFINEFASKNELEYQRLVKEQSKHRMGTHQYIELAFKLSAAKHKKTVTNRIVNNIAREDKYKTALRYIVEKHGEEAAREIIAKIESDKMLAGLQEVVRYADTKHF